VLLGYIVDFPPSTRCTVHVASSSRVSTPTYAVSHVLSWYGRRLLHCSRGHTHPFHFCVYGPLVWCNLRGALVRSHVHRLVSLTLNLREYACTDHVITRIGFRQLALVTAAALSRWHQRVVWWPDCASQTPPPLLLLLLLLLLPSFSFLSQLSRGAYERTPFGKPSISPSSHAGRPQQ
jgi:hypothetical protein